VFLLRRRPAVLLLLLALRLAGCSFFIPPPENETPTERLNCGRRAIPTALDTTAAVAGMAYGGFVIANDTSSASEHNLPRFYVGLPLVLVGVVYAVAATYGYHLLQKCRQHNLDCPHQ